MQGKLSVPAPIPCLKSVFNSSPNGEESKGFSQFSHPRDSWRILSTPPLVAFTDLSSRSPSGKLKLSPFVMTLPHEFVILHERYHGSKMQAYLWLLPFEAPLWDAVCTLYIWFFFWDPSLQRMHRNRETKVIFLRDLSPWSHRGSEEGRQDTRKTAHKKDIGSVSGIPRQRDGKVCSKRRGR